MSQGLYVGFARGDISPTICSVPLGGFASSEKRFSGVIGDPLYVNAVALKSGEETIVYLSTDLIGIPREVFSMLRKAVVEKTGLPEERIFICGSHTHSGPDMRSTLPAAIKYREEQLAPTIADAAYRALKDLQPAKLSYGTIEVGLSGAPMNFCRHYFAVPREKVNNYTKEDMEFAGMTNAKFDKEKYCMVGHMAEPDRRMHLLRFQRDGADDVLFVNFTAHATIVGAETSPLVSSDWPGALVQRLERLIPGTKCAFLQGCAGNLTPGTRIESEGLPGLTIAPNRDHHAYASVLAGYAQRLIEKVGLTDSESDVLTVRHETMTCTCDHSLDHMVPTAEKALEVFNREGRTPAARECWRKYGFFSLYPPGAILRRAKLPETEEIELNAIRIGDCAITTYPFEAFCSSGERIKAASPFAMTVVNAYSCGYQSYLPTLDAPKECYESYQMHYVPGTAEKIEAKLTEMLDTMK